RVARDRADEGPPSGALRGSAKARAFRGLGGLLLGRLRPLSLLRGLERVNARVVDRPAVTLGLVLVLPALRLALRRKDVDVDRVGQRLGLAGLRLRVGRDAGSHQDHQSDNPESLHRILLISPPPAPRAPRPRPGFSSRSCRGYRPSSPRRSSPYRARGPWRTGCRRG